MILNNLDLNQDTVRQRRNLVVTSLLLIFVGLGEVEFGEVVSFLGATLQINNPEIIVNGLLAFNAYFLWRFYQYFSTDKAYSVLLSQYREYMDRYTSLKIVKMACKALSVQSLIGGYSYQNLKRVKGFEYTLHVTESQEYDSASGTNVENTVPVKISLISVEVHRLFSRIGFIFRSRLLTDYFVPYILVVFSVFVQFT